MSQIMRVRNRHRYISAFLTGCLLLAPLPAFSQAPNSVRSGYTLLNEGLVNQAIDQFTAAVRQYPSSVEARLGLAIAYRRAGRNAEALQAYESVLAIDSQNRLALLSVGTLGGYRQQWQERGIAALDTLISLDPNDAEALTQRALLYGYQGKFAAAIADYEIVLRNNPPAEAVLGAAQVYAYSGDYDTSLDLFNQYQRSGGRITGDAATAYARSLRETGNPSAAVQVLEPQLRQLRELNGVAIRTRAELAIDYAATGQRDRAEQTLEPLQGRTDSRMIVARSLIAMSRYDAQSSARYTNLAIALFQNILTRTPQYLTVSIGQEIADSLSAYPQTQDYALEIYRQLAQQQPDDRSLQIQQAVLERNLGQISRATLQQRLAAALQPLPSDAYQQKVIAQALTRLDAPDPGLLPYYQSLLDTEVPLLYFRIAQMQIQRNDLAAARTALTAYDATSEGRRSQEATLLLLAEIDRREGNLEASVQRYETIISRAPSDAGIFSGALQGLAGIRQSQGRLPEAVAVYDRLLQLNPQDDRLLLGRASLAYQAKLISQAEAEAVLDRWLASHTLTDTSPELVSLTAALPADPRREALYTALLQENPESPALQLRYVQVLATRSPAQAQAYVNRLIANDPANVSAYFVQGEVAQTQGNLSLASRAYQAILEQDPQNVDALSALGGVRFQQRRYDSASQLYTSALELEPENAIAQTALISLTAAQGKRLTAIEQLEALQQSAAIANPDLARQQQLLEEGFLQQRGFQPPWERF
ncbi:MAG: tetratricopeptide repeat protein [Oscillatoriophycideae cyanobacterium NC_groundwater_1537_Pr4_S-0.65um_50_18]|nr:tetratricopeptide repeat protein [Oscillatoriophycideae cyanobacterium NC_groundwater_1537_Pr4_S-0.65um_50_18]